MDKLGTWITMQHGLVVDGGNKAMHSVNSGVRFTSKSSAARMMIETVDAGIVVFGEPTGFPTQGPYGNQEPDLSKGVSSMLHNNLWGTNVRRAATRRGSCLLSYFCGCVLTPRCYRHASM